MPTVIDTDICMEGGDINYKGPKWEYKTISFYSSIGDHVDKKKILNQLGTNGWELVSVDNNIAYLKRVSISC